jgi:hypothetical protein
MLRSYLAAKNYQIIQLVHPGGQAPISLTYRYNTTRKTVFPDLICLSEDNIIVGEIKPKYSARDKSKLNELENSIDAEKTILKICMKRSDIPDSSYKIKYILIHGDISSYQVDGITQWILYLENDIICCLER